ncbi:hypothetical protein CR513_09345, partial [Mucuna pruriens]
MGEKELIINTPLPAKFIEGDEEALETSFQAAEAEGGDPNPSWVAVMAAKPGKGLGRELHDIAESVTIQENSGRPRHGYTGAAKRENPGRGNQNKQRIRPDLYQYFTSGGIISPEQIAMVEDQPLELAEWIYPTERDPNTETSHQIDNTTLASDNIGESSRSDEGEDLEEEDLEELERLLEQERLRLQSRVEEIEVINLGEESKVKEIQVGKLMPPDLRQRLVELLREYADMFARSY